MKKGMRVIVKDSDQFWVATVLAVNTAARKIKVLFDADDTTAVYPYDDVVGTTALQAHEKAIPMADLEKWVKVWYSDHNKQKGGGLFAPKPVVPKKGANPEEKDMLKQVITLLKQEGGMELSFKRDGWVIYTKGDNEFATQKVYARAELRSFPGKRSTMYSLILTVHQKKGKQVQTVFRTRLKIAGDKLSKFVPATRKFVAVIAD